MKVILRSQDTLGGGTRRFWRTKKYH